MLLPRLGNAISAARLNSKRYGYQNTSVSRQRADEIFTSNFPAFLVSMFRAQDEEVNRLLAKCINSSARVIYDSFSFITSTRLSTKAYISRDTY